jgi:hypothetical protein
MPSQQHARPGVAAALVSCEPPPAPAQTHLLHQHCQLDTGLRKAVDVGEGDQLLGSCTARLPPCRCCAQHAWRCGCRAAARLRLGALGRRLGGMVGCTLGGTVGCTREDCLGSEGDAALRRRQGCRAHATLGRRLGSGGDATLGRRLGSGGDATLGRCLGSGGDATLGRRLGSGGDATLGRRLGSGGDPTLGRRLGSGGDATLGRRLGSGGDPTLGCRLQRCQAEVVRKAGRLCLRLPRRSRWWLLGPSPRRRCCRLLPHAPQPAVLLLSALLQRCPQLGPSSACAGSMGAAGRGAAKIRQPPSSAVQKCKARGSWTAAAAAAHRTAQRGPPGEARMVRRL